MPTILRPELPPQIDEVFARVLAKRPDERYGSCREFVQAAQRALDAAHRKGLVHRDVKPGNLLIERGSDDADPDHVYLADFGITKHAMSRSGLTSTGQFLGTIDYVAPEQIRGTSVLGLADQYSLRCVLYECLTGRVPFEKDLDAAIIWAHVEETPTMPTALRPDLPPQIDDVFRRVLSKQPGDRYQSCREFIDAARMAMGIRGGTTESSLAYGVTATGLAVSAPPGGQAGAPTDWYSWSSPSRSDRSSGGHSGYDQPGAGQPGSCDLHRAGPRHHRSRLPDLPQPESPVRRLHRRGLLAERRKVPAGLRRLRLPGHLRRGRLEPPVPAHPQVHGGPDDHGHGHR